MSTEKQTQDGQGTAALKNVALFLYLSNGHMFELAVFTVALSV